jgi:CBS domain-containing protein
MSNGEIVRDLCQTPVITVGRQDRVRDAAERMAQSGVGCVVVEHDRRPVAILTDRDLALAVLCEELDPGATRVEDVMGHAPITISERETLHAAADRIRAARIRRLPVVDDAGVLVGLLSADDLMLHVAGRLSRICEVIQKQVRARGEGELDARD